MKNGKDKIIAEMLKAGKSYTDIMAALYVSPARIVVVKKRMAKGMNIAAPNIATAASQYYQKKTNTPTAPPPPPPEYRYLYWGNREEVRSYIQRNYNFKGFSFFFDRNRYNDLSLEVGEVGYSPDKKIKILRESYSVWKLFIRNKFEPLSNTNIG